MSLCDRFGISMLRFLDSVFSPLVLLCLLMSAPRGLTSLVMRFQSGLWVGMWSSLFRIFWIFLRGFVP